MTPGQDAKDARTLHDCRATRFQPFDPPPDAFPMLPFPAFAFVDLETTGTRAGGDRITEIGIVRVDCASPDAPPRVTEWATLVDPQVPIPGVIQALTGISDAMVSGAPIFSTIAPRIHAMLDGCIFAAHNARFDFGFLKHAFARLGHDFSPRTLCTLRLARRLDPDAQGHGLDALLRESELIKSRMPARNRTLRRKAEAGIMEVVDGVPRLELARDRA